MDQVNLQDIVDAHFHRLLQLRDGVVTAHVGLLGLDELDWQQYRANLPPEPTAGITTGFYRSAQQARAWITANALRDIFSLHVIFFEQIRQFTELARVTGMDGDVETKNAEARRAIETKPVDFGECVEQVSRLLGSSFDRLAELKSLDTLFAAFSAQAGGGTLSAKALTVTLDLPEISTGENSDGVPYSVRRIVQSAPNSASIEATKELIYGIFFTAFTICRELAEACHQETSRMLAKAK